MNKNRNARLLPSLALFATLLTISFLSGCGGGGSDAPPAATYSVSGTVTAASATDIDVDTNDPVSSYNDNGTAATAQLITNPVTVGGFATRTSTGNSGDRFASGSDIYDWYRATLSAGQTILLDVSDHDGTSGTNPDLDLYLFTTSNTTTPIKSSENQYGNGVSENILITSSEDYYILVYAFSGASNYTLSIGQTAAAAPIGNLRLEDEFVPGEVIVRFNETLLSANFTGNKTITAKAQSLGLLHKAGDFGRPVLLSLGNPATKAAAFQALGIDSLDPMAEKLASADMEMLKKYDTIRAIKALRKRADIKTADLNYIRQASKTPVDEYYSYQWHYPLINLPQAWDITTGNASVIVAVVDTGIILSHPDLNNRVCQFSSACQGYDFISNTTIANDGDGIDFNPDDPGDGSTPGGSSFHGTHVAGTIGAETNTAGPGSGVAGVTWDTKIMPIRVLGKGGGTSYDIQQGLLYAAGLANDSGTVPFTPAQIINLSLGGSGSSQTEQDVYTNVRNNGNYGAGVIIIAAAGNENTSSPSYPASYDGVVSVSAVDMNKARAPYSNYGSMVDVAAPGGDTSVDLNADGYADGVLSTVGDDSGSSIANVYKFYQGTSMAAPHMAGVVALMKAVKPDLTPDDLDAYLLSGSITEDIGTPGKDVYFGHGMIDALKAVKEASTGIIPPTLSLSPSSLNFGASTTSLTVEVADGGGTPLTVNSPTENASWITSVTLTTDLGSGKGTYTVEVDRAGLTESTASASITFPTTSAGSYTLPVNIRNNLSNAGNTGLHWMILWDPTNPLATNPTTHAAIIGSVYNYSFSAVPAGTYYVLAGTDSDNDGYLCDPGEACSGYPTVNALTPITISSSNISGINFTSGYNTSVQSASAGIQSIPPQGISFRRDKRIK
ncbi:MAG: S8 family serine peptidase [Proteobacteria bacterium]|nr:S8 family serine peptidase [Pseudomonadota bacterium]MBU1709093.1 S8 family serine peptidase [Pseudomonadota bacterium]